jgi:hypothetical protein
MGYGLRVEVVVHTPTLRHATPTSNPEMCQTFFRPPHGKSSNRNARIRMSEFVVFDLLSSNANIRGQVDSIVEAFQLASGDKPFSSLFGGYWIGKPHIRFAS